MSNLTDLVPPLELCKLIPRGEFADSTFTWWQITPFEEWNVTVRSTWTTIPAPTLQEILEVLPHDDAYNTLILSWSEKIEKFTGWHIYYIGDRKRHCYDQSAATAALKLYLKLSDQSDLSDKNKKR